MSWETAHSHAHRGAARGLQDAARALLAASTKVAPIESDRLIQSAGTDLDDRALVASVFYDEPYAVLQHEDLTERHDPGRTGKYLEVPLHSEAPALFALIGRGVRGGLDR